MDIFPSLLYGGSMTEVSLREGMPRRLLLVTVLITVVQLRINTQRKICRSEGI